MLGSIQPQPIEHAEDGSLPLEKIKAAIKADDIHFAKTRLLALENTIGGKLVPQLYMKQATELAHSLGLSTHLDGARLFNAAVASGLPLNELTHGFDSVSICFSKGLGAPVGSVLVGTKELIEQARRWRKVLGGGMRQSGFLAAACLYALEHNISRLAEDHRNAEDLAAGLKEIAPISNVSQATNMVFACFAEKDCSGLESYLRQQGILAEIKPRSRFVIHLDVDGEAIRQFIAAIKAYFQQG